MKLAKGVVLLGIFAGSMHAEALLYNQNLTNGVYFGSGNTNGAFTVSNGLAGNIEIGLRAGLRQVGPVTPTTNQYTVPVGTQVIPTVNNARAAWNYEFSVDLTGSGLVLAQTTSVLTITSSTGSNTPFNLQLLPDNTVQGGLRFQNSENPIFGNPLAPIGYNVNAADTYTITLQVFQIGSSTNTLLGTDTIEVTTVTPEPASYMMFGLGLVGIYFGRRRRRS